MKLKMLILTVLLLIFASLHAQITDDFSDGDFLENPTWYGDTAKFIVNAQNQLQLNADEAGRAQLYLPHSIIDSEWEWRFSIRLAFAPSSGNFARVYLAADSAYFGTSSLCGYYLQFGEAGSDDVIELFQQVGDSVHSVCRGHTSIAHSFNYNIKVTKSIDGLWIVYSDTARVGMYVEECRGYGEFFTQIHLVQGFYCQFTVGNRTKFYFDDYYSGPPLVDTLKPSVTDFVFNIQTPNQLLISFSELVSDETALNPLNYRILEYDQRPALCEFVSNEQLTVRLYFSDSFVERHPFHLEIKGISDIAGNLLNDTVCNFFFCIPQWNEVLISELMPDPSPPVNLPETEYIELYNTLPFALDLSGWKLKIGNSERLLPDVHFSANGYIIIVAAASIARWADFENVYSISSMSLTDEGQQIVLYDNCGNVIHHVSYSKLWHSNVLKREGGWSLEMMDVRAPCSQSENWNSSQDSRGGTPGFPNSIATSNVDAQPPELLKITVPDARHIRIYFSEPVIADSILLPSLFQLDHALDIVAAQRIPPDFCVIELSLSSALLPRVVYILSISAGICDCVGLEAQEGSSLKFGLPETISPGDVVINELLSNPFDDTDADFVELYNRSEKLIDVGHLYLGTGEGDLPDAVVSCVPNGLLLFPHELVAICKNRKTTLAQYVVPDSRFLVDNASLPALPNDEGTIHLLDSAFTHIDRLVYDKSMHYALLTSTDGVSLERIHYDAQTQDISNWTSAAESSGWATPGAENSQFSELAAASEEVSVIPEVFSPDGDGYHDFAEIYCHFPESENRITIDVLNRRGQRIFQLANNQICGYDERFRWDGLLTDGRPVTNDIYIVCIQLWNANGKRKIIRRTVAVTRRE